MTEGPWPHPGDAGYWADLLGRPVAVCRAVPMTGGHSPSRLWRVHLRGPQGEALRLVVKDCLGPWSAHDPDGHRREAFVYHHLLEGRRHLAPRLRHLARRAEAVRLVLEDLEPSFALRPARHLWTPVETTTVADLYARLQAATQDHAALSDPVLMPAPDRRWPLARILAAAAELGRRLDWGGRWPDLAAEAARRFPPGAVSVGRPCLLHSDFGPANVALTPAGHDGRLLDWHIAAAGGAGFELAGFFFQPWSNHRHVDVSCFLDACDRARAHRGLSPWYDGDRDLAFAYAATWCALSYLPPIAARTAAGGLSGWWLHTAAAVHERLTSTLPP